MLRKKWMLAVIFGLHYFMSGLEYSLIISTIILYMGGFHDSTILLTGCAISMYPLGSLLSTPFVKHAYYRTKKVREIMLILNVFEIGGNILYSFSISLWFPFFGRLVAGFGGGFFEISATEISKYYPNTYHTIVLPSMHFSRIFGLIIGPALNFAYKKQHLSIAAKWALDYRTLPGLTLALSWSLMFVLTIIFVGNFGIEKKISFHKLDENKQNESALLSTDTSLIHTDDFGDEDEVNIENEAHDVTPKDETSDQQSMRQIIQKHFESLKKISSPEYFVIVIIDIFLWISQGIFEVLALYIAVIKFNWDSWIVSSLFITGGVAILGVTAMLYVGYRVLVVNEIHLIGFSLVFTHLAFSILVFEETMGDLTTKHWLFGTMYGLVFITIPLNGITVPLLFRKMLRKDLLPVAKTISSGISWFAIITGPVIASGVYHYRASYGALLSILTFFLVLCLFWMVDKIKKRIIEVRTIELT